MRPAVVCGALAVALLNGRAVCAQLPNTLRTDTIVADTVDFVAVPEPPRRAASVPLPVDHWSVRAARRARDLGLAPEFFPAQRSVPRARVAEALQAAAAAAEGGRHARLAEGWLRRFTKEFPEFAEEGGRRFLLGGALLATRAEARGLVEPARGLYVERTDLPRRDDLAEWAVGGTGAVALGPVAVIAEPLVGTDGVRVPLWDASVEAGPLAFAFGRQPVGYGPVRGGGIILSGSVPLVRAQVQTPRPVRLPSLLRYLGPVSAHTSLTRLEEPRHPGTPWFWTARLGVQPHSRVEAGVSRASVFGGDSISTPVNAENVARMLLGILSLDFENQIVAADFRWRLPTEPVLPATVYLEWGSEDASGAWWNVPGRTVGALFPSLPGAPAASLGAEYTSFATQCCGNPPWYLHGSQSGGWVYRGEPLGHPLGGEGWEALLYADVDALDARLRLSGNAFLRHRSDDGLKLGQRAGNLYTPVRTGRSVGGSVDAALRLTSRVDGRLSLYHDAGDGWRERRYRLNLSYLF